MANLNFQQPPRSIQSAALSGRTTAGFGNSSLSGHVTPTSGMFPPGSGATGNASYGQQQQQQQLSPNRNVHLGGISSVVGVGGGVVNTVPAQLTSRPFGGSGSVTGGGSAQRGRPMNSGLVGSGGGSSGGGGPMSSFMQSRGYGSQSGGNSINNFHSVFGNSTSETPPLLDLSEFPSLTNARGGGQNDQTIPQPNPLQPPGSKPYVGMVKQPTNEQTEFQMSNEDFPALPGTQSTDGQTTTNNNLNSGLSGNNNLMDGAEKVHSNAGGAAGMGMDLHADTAGAGNDKQAMKRGVQTSPDGKVTNIPASMVNNQYGMVGLLTFIRAAESDPNLVSLAMGQDLTALGLNLNSMENLYPSFGGPFADASARPQDIDYHVPPEYLINMQIREKLSQLTLKKYKDDLLFFLFYTNVGDFMQVAAAAELHSRDWRYHTEEKVWITRAPGGTVYEKNGNIERGTFYVFDAQNWRRVPKEFQVDTLKLDKCPNLNAYNLQSFSGQSV